MVQWVNRLRNNIFVNPPPLPLLYEISGALHLVQPGPHGRLADKIQVNFEIFKVGCRSKYSTCHFISQGTASLQSYQCIGGSRGGSKVPWNPPFGFSYGRKLWKSEPTARL